MIKKIEDIAKGLSRIQKTECGKIVLYTMSGIAGVVAVGFYCIAYSAKHQ